MQRNHTGKPKSRSSVKVQVASVSSSSHIIRKTQTNEAILKSRIRPSGSDFSTNRISAPRRSSLLASPVSKFSNVIDRPSSTSTTTALKAKDSSRLENSTPIFAFGFLCDQRAAIIQNLSPDERMFVSHLYNWGLNQARWLAGAPYAGFACGTFEFSSGLCTRKPSAIL